MIITLKFSNWATRKFIFTNCKVDFDSWHEKQKSRVTKEKYLHDFVMI